MYEYVRDPLVLIAFVVFIGVSLFRIISMIFQAKKEKSVIPTMSARFGLRSIAHWVFPFAGVNMRQRPFFTAVSFAFHFCLLVTPLLAMGHAVLWHESWGISWWSLPPLLADIMTVVVILGCAVFFLRRMGAPEVRNVTRASDIFLLLLVVSPFVTGFLAHQQMLPYKQIITAHIICGALWLIAIPFTRLSHMLWFAFTRAYMGSEFGKVRNARDW